MRRGWNLKGRKRAVTAFITALLALQGIYVAFPLPDIWPVSNYSMFSRAMKSDSASSIKIVGVTETGKEAELKNTADISPFDISRLRKGISRIIYGENFERKNAERVDRIVGALNFPPFDKIPLKEFINKKLLYDGVGKDKQRELESVSRYLTAQYKRNGGSGDFSEIRIYRVSWNWTGTKPSDARMEKSLIYSTKTGMKGK